MRSQSTDSVSSIAHMKSTRNLANNVAYKFQYLARQYRAQFDAEVEPLGLTRSQPMYLADRENANDSGDH